MAHYVISDLHGERQRFHDLLEKIGFSGVDTLYILGDVVDRGEDPIGLLQEIIRAENMHLLLGQHRTMGAAGFDGSFAPIVQYEKWEIHPVFPHFPYFRLGQNLSPNLLAPLCGVALGNHEDMCLRCYGPDATEIDWRRWNRNNNLPTRQGLDALPHAQRQALLAFLRALPVHLELAVNGRKFYLVHGFPGDCLHDEVWGRPKPDTPAPRPGVQVIVGHTPVCCLGRSEEEEETYNRELARRGEHMRVFHAPGFIDLDCGCGYDIPDKALACLRLEDMEEFYA